jgi:serine/threonine-protein kinase
VLVVLAVAAAIGVYAFKKGATTYATTPAVATLSRDAAGAKIRAVGLTPVAGPQIFSETVGKGLVIRTAPGPNEKVESGTNVVMTISKGPERYAVPKLKGESEADAKKAITAANLSVGTVTKAYSESVKEGDVVSSSPVAGKPLKKAAVVDLVVSKGPKPINVPSVVGSTKNAATARLNGLGLTPAFGTEIYSGTVPRGSVISQSPGKGASVPRGTTVTLVVSKGPPPVQVPNVVGQSLSSATARLQAAGLKVDARKLLPGPSLNRVYNQNPSGGTLPRGSTVQLGYV